MGGSTIINSILHNILKDIVKNNKHFMQWIFIDLAISQRWKNSTGGENVKCRIFVLKSTVFGYIKAI